MIEYFIARQPIYTARLDLHAYELFCRRDMSNSYTVTNKMEATCQVIVQTFTELGLEKLAGPHPVFIKTPREFLLGDYHLSCPRQKVYLELMAGERLDPALSDALRRLSNEGYRTVLHGLPEDAESLALLDRVSHVKLDVRRLGLEGLKREVERAGRYLSKLCAEKVETPAEYAQCKALSVPYVQGFFFCRPKVQSSTQVAPNRAALAQLLGQFNDPKITTDKLAKTISQDAALTHKLLRTLNSAFFGLPTRVDSVRQGLVLLGTERIKLWATMITLSRLVDKPHGLLMTGLLRAQMCEQLAPAFKLPGRSESFFLVGLFSVLDAMMDLPISLIVEKLPLTPDVVMALLNQTGPLGTALRCVLAYERGDFDKLGAVAIKADVLRRAYLEGVSWADTTLRQLLAPG